jgi:hypothetical protein
VSPLLRQIEEQDLGVFCSFDGQRFLVADGGTVSLNEFLAIQFNFAFCYLQPRVALRAQNVFDFVSWR